MEWISVKDRLPTVDEYSNSADVLVYLQKLGKTSGYYDIAYYLSKDTTITSTNPVTGRVYEFKKGWYNNSDYRIEDNADNYWVTHWMPISQPKQ